MGILGSYIKAWRCAAAELLGCVIINPDNEPFLLPSTPQIYERLVDLLSFPAVDAQAATVGAFYNLAKVNMDCRLKLASKLTEPKNREGSLGVKLLIIIVLIHNMLDEKRLMNG